MQVTTGEDLVAAQKEADRKQKDKLWFIQCKLDQEDSCAGICHGT